MATKAQIKANRANAKKSTGPRSKKGKERSARNALKHGFLAREAVMPGEDAAEFDQQLCEFQKALRPDNALEFEFVRQMVDAQWRLRRLTRIEAAFLTAALDEARHAQKDSGRDDLTSDGPNDSAGYRLLLGQAVLNRTGDLLRLARYDSQLQRRFYRAIDKLAALRDYGRRSREYYEKNPPDPHDHPDYVPYDPPASRHPGTPPADTAVQQAARIGFRASDTAQKATPEPVNQAAPTKPPQTNRPLRQPAAAVAQPALLRL